MRQQVENLSLSDCDRFESKREIIFSYNLKSFPAIPSQTPNGSIPLFILICTTSEN